MSLIHKIILAIAFVAGSFFIGSAAISQFLNQKRIITVKGLAELEIKADLVSWTFPIEIKKDTYEEAKQLANENIKAVKGFLMSHHIPENIIEVTPPIIREKYLRDRDGNPTDKKEITATCNITVVTENLDLVEAANKDTATLFNQNVMLNFAPTPNYIVRNFDQHRSPLISIASKSALKLAHQMSRDLNMQIKDVISADQGHIEERHPDGVGDAASSKIKKLRVVSYFKFSLR